MSPLKSTKTKNETSVDPTNPYRKEWVRGVNIGGWLVLERYITPYMFAVTDCHFQGDLCWYPGQVSAPSSSSKITKDENSTTSQANILCDFYSCKPQRKVNQFGQLDFPLDEYMLAQAFTDANPTHGKEIATEWLNTHFENFVRFEDLAAIRTAGVTHVRVPLPHFILGDVHEGEPWIPADRWRYFIRLLKWCDELGIQVWPDIHTAPGSQNGFDNSGQSMKDITCQRWSSDPQNVARTLQAIHDITYQLGPNGENLQHVVTGFGLLNEPFKDCDRNVYQQFMDEGLRIVRTNLANPNAAIYVSDMFLSKIFNDGQWEWLGLNEKRSGRHHILPWRNSGPTTTASLTEGLGDTSITNPYQNTYLDSHYYHVFAEAPRAMSPRQHIAFVCQNEFRDTVSCCYEDYPYNTKPAPGVQRMVGEWSAAYDTLPMAMLKQIMDGIAVGYIAPHLDRQMSPERKQFLKHFVQAQMVAYEAASTGTTGAWFYWTLKMEGGAFAEWDYLRGLEEKWIPALPPKNVTSESLYGTCYDIIFKTDDSMAVVDEFPDPESLPANDWKMPIDDDVVVTHGESLLHGGRHNPIRPVHHQRGVLQWLLFGTVSMFVFLMARFVWRRRQRGKEGYSQIGMVEGHASLSV